METDPPLIRFDQHAVGDPVARSSRLLKMITGGQPLGMRAGGPQDFECGRGRRGDRWRETVDTRFGPVAVPDVDLANGPVAEQIPDLPGDNG